ncbi:hypothetical protein [Streptomyces sp. NPDC048637]|uniref:hypothetical protein n=1 Tax=Streptomyces sp. NPDC048637 TaxID=3155636 RepID=UPI003416CD80
MSAPAFRLTGEHEHSAGERSGGGNPYGLLAAGRLNGWADTDSPFAITQDMFERIRLEPGTTLSRPTARQSLREHLDLGLPAATA